MSVDESTSEPGSRCAIVADCFSVSAVTCRHPAVSTRRLTEKRGMWMWTHPILHARNDASLRMAYSNTLRCARCVRTPDRKLRDIFSK